ncbi:hypothetical protein ACF0H5_002724 [Mactra antiquata]
MKYRCERMMFTTFMNLYICYSSSLLSANGGSSEEVEMGGNSNTIFTVILEDKELKEKAENELHETNMRRQEETHDLVNWINHEQNNVPKLTDYNYTLAFLRASKFNQIATRIRLENYWYSRRKAIMHLMNNVDPASPEILNILRSRNAVYIPLPGYDREGRKVILAQWDQLDVTGHAYTFKEWFRAITVVFDALCFLDEKVMVNGVTFLMDAKGVAMKHITFFGFNNCRKQFVVMQNGYPIRIKQVHYINNNRVIAFFLGLVKSVLSTKLANRIQLHGYEYDSVFDYIDHENLPSEYLHDNYKGEHSLSTQDIMERFIRDTILKPHNLDFLRRLYGCQGNTDMSDFDPEDDDLHEEVINENEAELLDLENDVDID